MTVQNELTAFFDPYPMVKVKKGELILQPDLYISHIFYLVNGYVRMYKLLASGKELTITIFKPRSFFPLFLAIDAGANTYYFESFTESIVKQVPVDDVLGFVNHNQEVLLDFTRRTSRGMQGILENLQYQLFGTVTQRTIATLVMLAGRFGQLKENKVHIELPISHQDIANFVGVARETISIEMNNLQKRGLVSSAYKHITISNLQSLTNIRDGIE
ncbi:MAG: Crp/Fnr family transcriptional regulator [Microgenomates group bacterium]